MRRTRDDRVIGGVCGGLGRYLGVDPGMEKAGIDAELSVPAPGAAPRVRLEASVGIGEVQIEHV